MKNKKWMVAGIAGLCALGLAGCGHDNDKEDHGHDDKTEKTEHSKDHDNQSIDASKYTSSPKDLAKQFQKQYKGYNISEIKVDEDNGKAIYEVNGYNPKEKMEATLQVDASKTSEVIHKESETVDSHNSDDTRTFDVNKVKVTPEKAMSQAKKDAKLKTSPTEWKLEKNSDGKVIYKIEFDKDHQTVGIDANSGKMTKAIHD